MHNQHAGLSQLPAEQRITQRQEQAVPARLAQALVCRAADAGG